MDGFRIDAGELAARRVEAGRLAGSPDALVARARSGERLADVELAALLTAPAVETDTLLELARAARPPGAPRLETFSPLYMTNECDAECLMCGMRGTNGALVRETADDGSVEEQLAVLRRRGMRGVALLTGEYRHGPQRDAILRRVAAALRTALATGFEHVLINIGSLETADYDVLLAGVPRTADGRVDPRVTMCTFQEAYDPEVYARFMGTNGGNPRSDYGRRLTNFDRAADAGMWSMNPGVLLGLNDDLASELLALLAHVAHLRARGLDVYISLPRLRKASGAPYTRGVSDDELARIVAVLGFGRPEAKVVISTREAPEIQRRLVPVIAVLTPGSPGVAPYTETGARFDLEASQFEVLDHRPFEVILGEFLDAGAVIACFDAGGGAPAG